MTDTLETRTHGYGLYFKTWLILLFATLVMLGVEYFHLPRITMVLALVAFMLIKASLIAGNFMHLRFERRTLLIAVATGLLITGAVMFFLMATDGFRLLGMHPA